MNNIDFLPTDYQREHARRCRQAWQIAAIVFVTAALSAAALLQSHCIARLQSRIDGLSAKHQEAEKRNRRLAALKDKLRDSSDEAELFTYLRHPWPRTQIIASLIRPLPPGITLQAIRIGKHAGTDLRRVDDRSQLQRQRAEERLASLSAAARDLEALRRRTDHLRTELSITGTTPQPESLHVYVGHLAQDGLFVKAELESCEADRHAKNGQMLFKISVLIRPGYGQAGGPTGSHSSAWKSTKHEKQKQS